MDTLNPAGIDLAFLNLHDKTDEELHSLRKTLSDWFDSLQELEPEDPESAECFRWLSLISDIEDAIDDIDELLGE